MDANKYKVCATCIYFQATKKDGRVSYVCSRLKYETKPAYSFNCWTPKQQVVRLMEKRGVLDE